MKPNTASAKTVVEGVVMELWRRKETHKLGEWNGCPNDMWLKYQKLPDRASEWLPWIDKMTHRPCWGVSFRQDHYTKTKWGETSVNGSVWGEITCNNRQVAEIRCRDFEYAFAKAQVMITEMSEHSFDFVDPEKMIGRKVYWREQPGVVGSHLMMSQGSIMIEYDGPNPGFDMRNCPWHGDCLDDEPFEKEVKVDILDHNIWWHRE